MKSTKNDPKQTPHAQQTALRELLPRILLLLWIELMIAAYFVVHKPWSDGSIRGLIGALSDLTISTAMVLLAGGLGRRILGKLPDHSALLGFTLYCLLGLGVLSLSYLLVGLLGGVQTWVGWLGLALGILFTRNAIRANLQMFPVILSDLLLAAKQAKVASAISILLLLSAALQALAPPLKWDSLVYHLEIPMRYLDAGRIIYLDDNVFVGFPQLAELLYTWALSLRVGSTAATLGWVVGLIGVFGVGGIAARLFGQRALWWGTAILLCGASLSQGLSWAYVDMWVLAFGVGLLAALEGWLEERSRKWRLYAGVMVGFAIGTKYTAGLLLPISALGLIWYWFSVQRPAEQGPHAGELVKSLLEFGLVAFLVVSPWLLKNGFQTGNPVYPFLFEARDMDALRLESYGESAPERSLLDDVLLPISVTVEGLEGGPGFNTSIGPLLIGMIPVLWIGWRQFDDRQRRMIGFYAVMALSTWLIWVLGMRYSGTLTRTRHYFGEFPILALLAVAGILSVTGLDIRRLKLGWIGYRLILLSLVLVGIHEMYTLTRLHPLSPILGMQTENEYLEEHWGWYGVVMQSLNELPAGSRVYMLWETRAFYCEVECSADVVIDRWWYLRRSIGDADAIAEHIKAQGFTHLLVYDLGAQFELENSAAFEPEDQRELARLENEILDPISEFADAYSLYFLKGSQ